MKIYVKKSRGFINTKKYFNDALEINKFDKINSVMNKAMERLRVASPNDTIANAWHYEINNTIKGKKIIILNDAIKDGENLAIMEDIGYASSSGVWVSGKNYLNKQIDKIYKDILKETWEELKNL